MAITKQPNRITKYATISIRETSRNGLQEKAKELKIGIGRMLECMLAMSNEEIMSFYEKSETILESTRKSMEKEIELEKARRKFESAKQKLAELESE